MVGNTTEPKGSKGADAARAAGRPVIVVEQVGSPIRRPAEQRAALKGLGLNKMHRQRVLEDTPAVRGMVAKLAHLVKIVEG